MKDYTIRMGTKERAKELMNRLNSKIYCWGACLIDNYTVAYTLYKESDHDKVRELVKNLDNKWWVLPRDYYKQWSLGFWYSRYKHTILWKKTKHKF